MDQSATTSRTGAPGLSARPVAGEVAFVSHRWEHLSAHAGYDRLVDCLAQGGQAPCPSPSGQGVLTPCTPKSRILAVVSRWPRWRRGGLDRYYTKRFRAQEDALIRAAARDPRPLYHFLYGESSFCRFKRARPEKNVVCTFHQPPSILERYIAEPRRFADVDAALIVGSSQREYFEQFLPPDKIHFVPHGIDTSVFTPARTANPADTKRLLFVGVWQRDFITARRTMEILGRLDPEIHLDVVTLPRFKGHFLGLDNVETHFGLPEEELIALYRRAALLLLPLIDTTFNNSLGEAIGCGLPVVASDVGSVRDYLNDDCAVLLPRRDVEAHADAVRGLLADPDRRAAMAVAARKRAEALDWSRTAPPVEALYRGLLA